jgi:hypothetical protein
MPRPEWRDDAPGGYVKDGVTYCCQGCLEGPGCTCRTPTARSDAAPSQEDIRDDTASGAFVQSLQRETKHISDDDYGTDVTKGKPPGTSASND